MSSALIVLISLLPTIPSLITTIEQLIARGKQTGELPPAEADALTVLANSEFAKWSHPAPPPPGVTPGPGA